MEINEIFASIQGEGRYMGVPSVFVRTCGCPVKCDFCDSKDSWAHGKQMVVEDICNDVARWPNIKHVVLTGGEPMIQRSICALARELKYLGYHVSLETSGFVDVPTGYFDWVVCSPKPVLKYQIAKYADELKYVVNDAFDFTVISGSTRMQYADRIWLQPMDEGTPESIKKNMGICYKAAMKDPRFRVGIQLHKIYEVR